MNKYKHIINTAKVKLHERRPMTYFFFYTEDERKILTKRLPRSGDRLQGGNLKKNRAHATRILMINSSDSYRRCTCTPRERERERKK